MADIFISYSSQDKTIVKQIAALLEAKGWTVWWDREIPIGQKYDTVIETELQNAGCVVVIWTQRSVQSEWVKNEALEAAGKNKLVPVMLENVQLPLAFKRIESAMLIGWNGTDSHPELDNLYQSIENILHPGTGIKIPVAGDPGDNEVVIPKRTSLKRYISLALFVLVAFALIVYSITHFTKGNTDEAGNLSEKTITIRVFDWKKNPLTDGNVKIYLAEYIRSQSIDNMGQALFTGIPAETAKRKLKIEVSSPGYATRSFDTLFANSGTLELVLPLTTVVMISGKVKTAAEMPINGVEINVDGTRYYAVSITDGSYNLRLQEYTLGDEVTITTSHKDYEDKTFSLKINSPEIKNEDIFLNPVKKK